MTKEHIYLYLYWKMFAYFGLCWKRFAFICLIHAPDKKWNIIDFTVFALIFNYHGKRRNCVGRISRMLFTVDDTTPVILPLFHYQLFDRGVSLSLSFAREFLGAMWGIAACFLRYLLMENSIPDTIFKRSDSWLRHEQIDWYRWLRFEAEFRNDHSLERR